MNMFTTACFIRKCTPEVCKELEELGYIFTNQYGNGCIATSCYSYCFISESMYDDTDPHGTWNCAGRIDCGTNEQLFLALAALRTDSDFMQWWTTDDCSEWYLSESNFCGKMVESIRRWHKATPAELIEHLSKI